jgi:transcription elongation factor GreA-like protein/transcription elongation GreA/GreB family factor
MSYLKDFQNNIANHDYPAFLRLWEEYCSGDELDAEEVRDILRAVKKSDISDLFGRHIDRILPLWKNLPPSPITDEILRLIIDIQTTNSDTYAELALNYLTERYAHQPNFSEKMRLIGMRGREKVQGSISAFELLNHMEKGNFVFHSGGWGVGEIVDVSMVREQLTLEFDYVPGKKDLSFATAFKTLTPIPHDHFLALRFGNPDLLEQKAKENPAEVIRMLLRDLGPKTAAEIKDELCELVIPANEWTRWWQTARAKVKKDTMVETPDELRDPFRIRQSEITHEERLQKLLENKPDANTLIQTIYSFVKDFPETLKHQEFKQTLIAKLNETLSLPDLTVAQSVQLHFFLQDLNNLKKHPPLSELIMTTPDVKELVDAIQILSFKKRVLSEVRAQRNEWKEIFLDLFFKIDQSTLRDYMLAELMAAKEEAAINLKLNELCDHPGRYPEIFIWYFQKAMGQKNIPLCDQSGRTRLFESLLILLSAIEHAAEHRDLVKKIHSILSNGRFALVREIMQHSSVDEVKEFLLLVTKCHSLGDHDLKILHSLAEVAHPSLSKLMKKKQSGSEEAEAIWTTKEGYLKLQSRIQQIATVETVENAREIEVARSHGDLRENQEFKSALEKRSRLQSELKQLSEQLNKARIITQDDISLKEVGIGSVVECTNKKGQKVTYTLLGPWDADTDKNILSFQSKLAQAMTGKGVGDTFQFQGEEYTIGALSSYL